MAREEKKWPAVARESMFLAREGNLFHLHPLPLPPRSRGLTRGRTWTLGISIGPPGFFDLFLARCQKYLRSTAVECRPTCTSTLHVIKILLDSSFMVHGRFAFNLIVLTYLPYLERRILEHSRSTIVMNGYNACYRSDYSSCRFHRILEFAKLTLNWSI